MRQTIRRMIRHGSGVVVAMATALTAATAPAACAQSKTECDCIAPGARVHVAPESAAAVTAVKLTGAACDGVTPACTQAAATGCETYAITPAAPGGCTVDVVFVDGTFTANLTFAQTTGCCAGIYPSPTSAGDIDAVRAPADAGGDA
jgi:hypothetical protein